MPSRISFPNSTAPLHLQQSDLRQSSIPSKPRSDVPLILRIQQSSTLARGAQSATRGKFTAKIMIRPIVALFALTVAVGCGQDSTTEPQASSSKPISGSPPMNVTGKWKGIPNAQDIAHAREHGHPPIVPALEINQDNTFTFSLDSHGQKELVEGEAVIDGTTVTLRAKVHNGNPIESNGQNADWVLKLSDTGKLVDEQGKEAFER